jgi:hypothetical protein
MRSLLSLGLVLLVAGVASADPPQVPARVDAPVGRPTLFTIKPVAGKRVGVGKGFDPAGLVLTRNLSDDPTVYEYQAFPNAPGVYYLTWWTEGEVTPAYTAVVAAGAPTTGTAAPAASKAAAQPAKADPAPIPAAQTFAPAKLALVVVEDTAAAATARAEFFRDLQLKTRLDSKGHAWRAFDRNVKDATGKTPDDAAPYLAIRNDADAAVPLPKSGPVLFVVEADTGELRFAGPCPKTPGEMLAVLEKTGG